MVFIQSADVSCGMLNNCMSVCIGVEARRCESQENHIHCLIGLVLCCAVLCEQHCEQESMPLAHRDYQQDCSLRCIPDIAMDPACISIYCDCPTASFCNKVPKLPTM